MNRCRNTGRSLRKILFAVAVMSVLLVLASAACAADWMAEARSMLKMINEFRTGGNAWYWNADNTTWTTETGLHELAYDKELEKVAQVRAAEIAVSLSHTRPDGTKWSTAFPAGNYYKAENIAAGFTSARDAFNGFLEESESYQGQGHRRNMLKRTLTRIGLAAVEVNGTVYWVQEFASGSVRAPLLEPGWKLENGTYYYIRDDGSRATGWLHDNGTWFYLDDQGVMKTGWVRVSGEWYYFAKNGTMQTGWQKIDQYWYYFDNNGVMQKDWQKISGKWYFFDDSGVMQKDWEQIKDKWYFFDDSGVMQTGWQKLSGNWFYFRSSGEMVTGRVTIDGQTEIFNTSGVWEGSEISDYDTPLGTQEWVVFLRELVQLPHTIETFIFGSLHA